MWISVQKGSTLEKAKVKIASVIFIILENTGVGCHFLLQGDLGSIPGLGRSPGEGNGKPLQYSCLENSMDRRAWQVQSLELQRVRHG